MIRIGILFVAAMLFSVAPESAFAKCPNGRGLSGMLQNICWSCMLPIRFMGQDFAGDAPDNASDKKTCSCDGPSGTQFGFTIGSWQPSNYIESTIEPYCFPSIEGTTMDKFGSRSMGYSGYRKGNKAQGGYMHFHLIAFPLLTLLDFFVDQRCNAGGFQDLDILLMSELDPMWSDAELSAFRSPEVYLLANPVAQMACAADGTAAWGGKPIDDMYWCGGSWGSLYPQNGYVRSPHSYVGDQSLNAAKGLAAAHKYNMAYSTVGDDALCGGEFEPLLQKQQYKFSHFFPRPEKNSSHWIGEPVLKWGAHRTSTTANQNYINLVYRWTDCCVTP